MKAIITALAVATWSAVAAAAAAPGPLVYVVTGQQQFGLVDLSTGAFQQIGPATPEGQASLVWLAGQLYSLTYSGNLETIDPGTGLTRVVGPTGLGYDAFNLAEARGQLYATDFSNNLYLVDRYTGTAQLVSGTGVPPELDVPFSFNADGTMNGCDETVVGMGGKLYATFDTFTIDPVTLTVTPKVNPNLYELDPSSGATQVIGPTTLNLGASVALAGRLYVFHDVATAFTPFGPQLQSEVMRLEPGSGATRLLTEVDPVAGAIFGAAPLRPSGSDGSN
jgi:hypothetical protein